MNKEQALANLLLLETKITHEANSPRGESKKTIKEYKKALNVVCEMLGINSEDVEKITNP
ncbi:hypothetical protein PQE75_gp044 [Bacillus phage vB_BcoS-136]|uniref:Uncharacterized protein n=1 Tax=Bacillus phage vB_BcoS-136 TaxID=2419619 RepID=A0A3G3BVU4_9CAUD|nr:hypothetical protein PQE75_gp044 [Bacillus phage vB_BcoS-136]AYP68176.1 hypothetical protein vBBcoS136_00044 [Bacillus phage vB_BcoS-136]